MLLCTGVGSLENIHRRFEGGKNVLKMIWCCVLAAWNVSSAEALL